VLMRRLAVFGGDFTLEAVTRVAEGPEGSAANVVKNLASLVAKSLVAVDVGGPTPHYRLLETMRAYALDRLTASGEFEAMTSRQVAACSSRVDLGPAHAGELRVASRL
jgi:predicted ATPase